MAPCAATVRTPVGPIHVTACRDGVCRFDFGTGVQQEAEGLGNEHLQKAVTWIRSYFAGKFDSQQPDLCYSNCSDFQKKVYEELRSIEAGKILSYKELSLKTMGNERTARAVGSAMRRNPYPLIVPCHRVIKSSGDLGAYGGGQDMKQELISHETRFCS